MTVLAVCIGCGCDDDHACVDEDLDSACFWIRLDREEGKGVCSACEPHAEAWDRGDRTSHAVPASELENPHRVPRPEQPRPPNVNPESGVCRSLALGDLTIRHAGKVDQCPHDWPFEDVEDSDCCRWCGMSFLHHIFAEAR
jgi:hypothetical protein